MLHTLLRSVYVFQFSNCNMLTIISSFIFFQHFLLSEEKATAHWFYFQFISHTCTSNEKIVE